MSFGDKLADYYQRQLGIHAEEANAYVSMLYKADDPVLTTTANYDNTVFGAEVFNWVAAADPTGWFAIFPKEVWPAEDGIRVVTGAPVREYGQLENAVLVDTDKPDVGTYRVPAKFEATPYDMTLHAEWNRNDPVGGSKDSFLREQMGLWHATALNEQLGVDGQTTGSATINLESIDRLISSNSEATNIYTNATAANPYGGGITLIRRSSADTGSDSVVDHNTDVDRALTIRIMDDVLDDVMDNHALEADLMWVTGRKTSSEISRLLGAKERFINPKQVTVGFDGVTNAGSETGFTVASHQNIPIMKIKNVASDGLPRLYLINRADFVIRVAIPTAHATVGTLGEMILQDNLKKKGIFLTGAELVGKQFNRSGKIRDLKAT